MTEITCKKYEADGTVYYAFEDYLVRIEDGMVNVSQEGVGFLKNFSE